VKALPLWQPWATLAAAGVKRVETRSYAPPIAMLGTRIAIYATKGVEPGGERQLRATCERLAPQLRRCAIGGAGELARGAIVGTVLLRRASQMTEESVATLERERPSEHAMGQYEPGRWAWVLGEASPLEEPMPVEYHGRGGWFDVDLDQPALF
jgi:activating signal cointegrator 1